MSDDETEARAAIEQKLANLDAAFQDRDSYGVTGYAVPGDQRRFVEARQAWSSVMAWIEDTKAHSEVTQFVLNSDQATVTVEQNRSFSFIGPFATSPWAGRLLLRLISRYVFLEREVTRQTWRKTQEGWLSENEKRLSYRLRVKRRQ